jgi:hypothetical protein
MSHRHPIDDLFRKYLKNHSEAPTMHIWNRIQEKRHRPTLVSSVFGTILTAAATTLMLCCLQTDSPRFDRTNPSFENEFLQQPVAENAIAAFVQPIAENIAEPIVYGTLNDVAGATAIHTYETSKMDYLQEGTSQGVEIHRGENEPLMQQGTISNSKWQQTMALPKLRSNIVKDRSYPSPSQCASFQGAGWKIFAEWLAGTEFSFRQLNAKQSSPDNINYTNTREQTEFVIPGFSAQLRLAAASKSGLVLRSGLHYARQREQLRHVTETEQRFTIINVLGPTGEVVGVDTVYETIIREERLPIRYHLLSVPLLAGFERRFGRLSAGFTGGAMVNIKFAQKGSIYLPNGDMPVSFATAKAEGDEIFQPRLGLGWYAAASLAWKMHPRIEIVAEPHLRAFPRSFNAPSFATAQQYIQSGIALGLRYAI